MKKTTVTQTKKVVVTSLYKKDLVELFKKAGLIPNGALVDIYMHVPGGGDWSQTNLYTDESETPLLISYEELMTKTE